MVTLFLGLLAACGSGTPSSTKTEDDCAAGSGTTANVQLSVDQTSQFIGTVPGNATWVAAQDGTCGWQELEGTEGKYQFQVKSGRFGVAVMCSYPDDQGNEVDDLSVQFLTTAEATSIEAPCVARLPASTPTHQIGGLLLPNIPDAVQLWVRNWSSDLNTIEGGTTQLSVYAVSGTHDLVAGQYPQDEGLSRLQFWRGLPSTVDTIETVDINSGDWITLGNLLLGTTLATGELGEADAWYITTHGTYVSLATGFSFQDPSQAPVLTIQVPYVKPEDRFGDELHRVHAMATNGASIRELEAFGKDPTRLALNLPTSPGGAHFNAQTTTGPFTVQFAPLPQPTTYVASSSQQNGSGTRNVSFRASAAYASGGTLTLPDLSSVPGWTESLNWVVPGSSWRLATISDPLGYAGEVAALSAKDAPGQLASLEGLVRSIYSESATLP
jgi:hypothetical protein